MDKVDFPRVTEDSPETGSNIARIFEDLYSELKNRIGAREN